MRRAADEKTDHGKSILNPRLIRQVNIHSSKLWTGRPLDEKGVTAPDTLNAGVPSWDVFRINHYWSRSIEDLKEKVGRGNASRPVPRQIDQHLAMEKTLNDVEDRLIQPLWEEIKARREQPSCPRTERE